MSCFHRALLAGVLSGVLGVAAQATEVAAVTLSKAEGLKATAPASAVCKRMSKPERPLTEWAGTAGYRALAHVQSGRVVKVEVVSLVGGLPRKLDRQLRTLIVDVVQQYDCPGDHVVEDRFDFKFGG